MQIFLYIIIVLIASFLGSIAGVGGGILMKPVMDALGDYSVVQIGIITACAAFTMSLVSSALRHKTIKNMSIKNAVSVSLGAVGGGIAGELLFSLAAADAPQNTVKIIQNAIIIFLLALILIYFFFSKKIKTYNFKNIGVYFVVGLTLGALGSFLGIGGGPFNVAVFVILFSMDMKTAAAYSLVTICFTQIAKLITIAITGGVSAFGIMLLPYVLIAAVAGGVAGSFLSKKLSHKAVQRIFNALLVAIIFICTYNIIVNAIK